MPHVQTRGATLFLTESGASTGPAILFSNSLGTTHRMWDEVVALLSADFRCICYDTRGHGRSTHDGRMFTIADLADDVVVLLDHLGLPAVHFAGLSLGGMTGQSLAMQHPLRLRSLTLMATSPHMPTEAAWAERAMLVRREGTAAIVAATMQRWFTPAFVESAPPALHRVRDEFVAIDRSGYAACCEAIGAMDLRPRLASIKTPTAIIAGREDPATPVAMMETIVRAVPGTVMTVLPDAAHLLAVEKPVETATFLRNAIARAG